MLQGQWGLLYVPQNCIGPPPANELDEIGVDSVSCQKLRARDSQCVAAESLSFSAPCVNVSKCAAGKFSADSDGPDCAVHVHGRAVGSGKKEQGLEMNFLDVVEEGPKIVKMLCCAVKRAKMIVGSGVRAARAPVRSADACGSCVGFASR